MIDFMLFVLWALLFINFRQERKKNQVLVRSFDELLGRVTDLEQHLIAGEAGASPETVRTAPLSRAAVEPAESAAPHTFPAPHRPVDEPALAAEPPVAPAVIPEPAVAPAVSPEPVVAHLDESERLRPPVPTSSPAPPPTPSRASQRWKAFEKKFEENWTGILGSVVMVLGVTFLGIYAALQVTPVYRCILIVAFSSGLWAAAYRLAGKETWRQFSHWISSSAAALFLFAAYGSSHLAPLRWIEGEAASIAVIAIGLAVNLYFAVVGGSQIFMSMHALLSLLALAGVNDTASLVLGALVVSGSILYSYRRRWDRHLLFSIALYGVFQGYWYTSAGMLDDGNRWTAAACILMVGSAAALMHYRKDYASQTASGLPIVLHLSNWAVTGFHLAYLSTPSPWMTIPILAVSGAAYLLARRARAIGVAWVYLADSLISHFLLFLALLSLNRWGLDWYGVAVTVFIHAVIFAAVTRNNPEPYLFRLATIYLRLAAIAALAAGVDCLRAGEPPDLRRGLFTSAIAFGIGILLHETTRRRFGGVFDRIFEPREGGRAVSLTGLTTGLFATLVIAAMARLDAGGVAISAVALAACLMTIPFRSDGFFLGTLVAVLTAQGILAGDPGGPGAGAVERSVPVAIAFLTACFGVFWRMRGEPAHFKWTSMSAVYVASAVFIVHLTGSVPAGEGIRTAAIGLAAALPAFAMHRRLVALKGETFECLPGIAEGEPPKVPVSPFGLLIGMIGGALGSVLLTTSAWGEAMTFALLGAAILVRQRTQSNGFGVGLLIALAFVNCQHWIRLFAQPGDGTPEAALKIAPILLLDLLAIRYSRIEAAGRSLRAPFIYLAGIEAAVGAYILSVPLSPLLPGVFWAMFSLVALAFAQRIADREDGIDGQPARWILHLGYWYILAFLARHVSVHLQAESYVGLLKTRLLIELFGLAVLGYWMTARKHPAQPLYGSWELLHPLLLETFILFGAFTVVVEVDAIRHPLVWALVANALAAVSLRRTGPSARLHLYALFFAWSSAIQMAAVTSVVETPSLAWHDQPLAVGLACLFLQTIFLVTTRPGSFLAGMEFPRAIAFLARAGETIARNRETWVYYPFFVCTALFLIWRFEAAILTLLLVAECFVVFALSIGLKVNNFKTFAMLALGVCLVRLIVWDMAQTETLMRGVVFLGVGGLMLMMNYIYRRFREGVAQ